MFSWGTLLPPGETLIQWWTVPESSSIWMNRTLEIKFYSIDSSFFNKHRNTIKCKYLWSTYYQWKWKLIWNGYIGCDKYSFLLLWLVPDLYSNIETALVASFLGGNFQQKWCLPYTYYVLSGYSILWIIHISNYVFFSMNLLEYKMKKITKAKIWLNSWYIYYVFYRFR